MYNILSAYGQQHISTNECESVFERIPVHRHPISLCKSHIGPKYHLKPSGTTLARLCRTSREPLRIRHSLLDLDSPKTAR